MRFEQAGQPVAIERAQGRVGKGSDRLGRLLESDGGKPQQCGWLSDRFGLSWQVIPVQLEQLMEGPDPEATRRAVDAMLKMVKIDVAALEAAARG